MSTTTLSHFNDCLRKAVKNDRFVRKMHNDCNAAPIFVVVDVYQNEKKITNVRLKRSGKEYVVEMTSEKNIYEIDAKGQIKKMNHTEASLVQMDLFLTELAFDCWGLEHRITFKEQVQAMGEKNRTLQPIG